MKNCIQICLLALAILVSGSAFGQHPGHKKHFQKLLEDNKAELKLTPEQEKQLDELHTKFKAQHEALKAQDFENPEDKREAMHSLFKEQKTAVDNIFTTEQKAILQAKMEARKKKHEEKMSKVDKKALHQELKTYREQNITPAVKAQRLKLESSISAEDQQTLQALRTTFKEMHQKRKQERANKEKGAKGKGKKFEKGSKDKKAKNPEMKAAHEKLKGLVEKYDGQITPLLEELKPQHEQWQKDMGAIAEKYMPKEESDAPKGKNHGKKHGWGKHNRMDKMPRKGHFLLMDPNATVEMDEEDASTLEDEGTFTVYPNPARATATAAFDVLNAGNYQLELRSENGNVIQVVDKSYRQKGSYQVSIDLGQLKNGIYYVVLTGESGVKYQKLVVNKG